MGAVPVIARLDALRAPLESAGPDLASIGKSLASASLTLRRATDVLAAAGDLDRLAAAAPYRRAKLVTAKFYCEQLVLQASGLLPAASVGAGDLLALSPAQFQNAQELS